LRIFLRDELCPLLALEVKLAIDPFTSLVNELHRMSTISVHEAVTVRDATVAHENHDLVDRLWVLGQVVPEYSRVVGMREMGCGMPLLSVDEMGEFCRVAYEEDGGVVVDHIPIAFGCAKLHRETARVSRTIMATAFSTLLGQLILTEKI
jgi:hypothetical protein